MTGMSNVPLPAWKFLPSHAFQVAGAIALPSIVTFFGLSAIALSSPS